MMKYFIALGVMMACTACVHTTEAEREEQEFTRVEYYETVFQPASRACRRAGGFMIYEDPTPTRAGMSYADMRMAMARGCSGI
jgi:hypothetical protein